MQGDRNTGSWQATGLVGNGNERERRERMIFFSLLLSATPILSRTGIDKKNKNKSMQCVHQLATLKPQCPIMSIVPDMELHCCGLKSKPSRWGLHGIRVAKTNKQKNGLNNNWLHEQHFRAHKKYIYVYVCLYIYSVHLLISTSSQGLLIVWDQLHPKTMYNVRSILYILFDLQDHKYSNLSLWLQAVWKSAWKMHESVCSSTEAQTKEVP